MVIVSCNISERANDLDQQFAYFLCAYGIMTPHHHEARTVAPRSLRSLAFGRRWLYLTGDGTGFRKHREFTRRYNFASVRIHSFAHICSSEVSNNNYISEDQALGYFYDGVTVCEYNDG